MKLEHLDAARRKGRTPDDLVILALVPLRRDAVPDTVAIIEVEGIPADLRCLVDLHVVVASTQAQTERAIELLNRCLIFGARDLERWIVDRNRWVSVQYNHKRYIGEVPPAW